MTTEFTSRDLTWEMGIKGPELMMREADAIDTKAMAVFATGTLIIGVFSALFGQIRPDFTVIPFVLASVSFLVLLVSSIANLKPRKYGGPDDPKILRERFWELPPDEAREHLWRYTEGAFKTNKDNVDAKGKALRYSVFALSSEVVLLITWLGLIASFPD